MHKLRTSKTPDLRLLLVLPWDSLESVKIVILRGEKLKCDALCLTIKRSDYAFLRCISTLGQPQPPPERLVLRHPEDVTDIWPACRSIPSCQVFPEFSESPFDPIDGRWSFVLQLVEHVGPHGFNGDVEVRRLSRRPE